MAKTNFMSKTLRILEAACVFIGRSTSRDKMILDHKTVGRKEYFQSWAGQH